MSEAVVIVTRRVVDGLWRYSKARGRCGYDQVRRPIPRETWLRFTAAEKVMRSAYGEMHDAFQLAGERVEVSG